MVEKQISEFKETYFQAKVNQGESYTMRDGEWSDWSTVVASLKEKNPLKEYDNPPIKAYADKRDYASVDALASLRAAVGDAQAALAAVLVSADGSDVAQGSTWVAQAEHDALAAAVAEAVRNLNGAGDFERELLFTTPTQSAVEAASAGLAAASGAFASALKAGGQPGRGSSAPARELAGTGDAAQAAAAAAGCTALLATLAVACALHRRRAQRGRES